MRLKCRTFYAGCTTFRASKRASKDMRIALGMPMLYTNSIHEWKCFFHRCQVYPWMPGLPTDARLFTDSCIHSWILSPVPLSKSHHWGPESWTKAPPGLVKWKVKSTLIPIVLGLPKWHSYYTGRGILCVAQWEMKYLRLEQVDPRLCDAFCVLSSAIIDWPSSSSGRPIH